MRKILIPVLFCLAGMAHTAQADDPGDDDYDDALSSVQNLSVDSHDPCTVFLCMAGMLEGEKPGECSGARKAFFNIVKKKHGHFNPWRTLNARKAFLGNCPSADGGITNKILDKYGMVR